MQENRQPENLIGPPSRSVLLHPLSLFVLLWTLTVALYAMHLSRLLIYDTSEVVHTALFLVVPYAAAIILYQVFCALAPKLPVSSIPVERLSESDIYRLDHILGRALIFWVICTLVEIVVSGGLPIIWLIRGSSKTYFDFGIPSVHGFLNSLVLAIALCEVGLFAIDGKKKRLWIPIAVVLWSIVVVTRNLMIVSLIQSGIIWGLLRGVNWRTLLKSVVIILVLILAFGYIGDFRSGAESFRLVAMPSDDYPDWLPSGVLWVYIYLTTPMGNLVHTTVGTVPLNSFLFPNTASLLFPTVIRHVVYGKVGSAEAFGGDLVASTFNVSTAYVGPYQDYGYLGVCCFSVMLALVAIYCWRKLGFMGTLMYGVIGQCVILTVFFNNLFDLPVITQIPWFYFFFRKLKRG